MGLIAMGIVKSLSPTNAEHFTKDGLDRLKVIAATPVISRAYASSKVLIVVGMIRMLKGFKSDDPQDREDFFYTLFMFTTNATASTMRLLPK
jgi:hypothetical protein